MFEINIVDREEMCILYYVLFVQWVSFMNIIK
jgi:hypothetical protein